MSGLEESDALFFFEGKEREFALYQALVEQLRGRIPDWRIQVGKSQISLYGRRLFGAVSLPVRRKKGWPERCILVTFGLGYRHPSPRIAVAVEPYPNRWTHHVLVERPEQIDEELLSWLQEAYAFAQSKK